MLKELRWFIENREGGKSCTRKSIITLKSILSKINFDNCLAKAWINSITARCMVQINESSTIFFKKAVLLNEHTITYKIRYY